MKIDKIIKKTGEKYEEGGITNEAGRDGEESRSAVVLEASNPFFLNRIAREQKQTNNSQAEAKWLTTREAAQYLRVSVSSIKMLMYRGRLRAHKLGRRNRFLRDELDRQITLPVSN